MRAALVILVMATGLASATATAQNPPKRTVTICLDPSGQRHQAICQRGTEIGDTYVCGCPDGLTPVTAPACAAGESPAPEGAAASQALKTALGTGTLNNVQVDGRRMCVQTRHVPG